MDALVQQLIDVPEGLIVITFDTMPEWWTEEDRSCCIDAITTILQAISAMFGLFSLPLHYICIDRFVAKQAARWQTAMQYPVEASPDNAAGVLGGKTIVWQHPDSKKRYGVILLSDLVAISLASHHRGDRNNAHFAVVGRHTLIHEVAHLVSAMLRNDFAPPRVPFIYDWDGIKQSLTASIWDEAFAERFTRLFMTDSDRIVHAYGESCIDYVKNATTIIEQSLASPQTTVATQWSTTLTYASSVLNQFGRCIGSLNPSHDGVFFEHVCDKLGALHPHWKAMLISIRDHFLFDCHGEYERAYRQLEESVTLFVNHFGYRPRMTDSKLLLR